MEDGYWDLFWQTGEPTCYLLRKHEDENEPGRQGPEGRQ